MNLESLIGTSVTFNKTLGEDDLLDFARVTGDSHPNHTDEAYAQKVGLSGRVAQGSLIVGLIAGASTRYLLEVGRPAVSYGYDRVRFLRSARIGDQLTIEYKVSEIDPVKSNASAQARVTNQDGELIAVGTNILHFT